MRHNFLKSVSSFLQKLMFPNLNFGKYLSKLSGTICTYACIFRSLFVHMVNLITNLSQNMINYSYIIDNKGKDRVTIEMYNYSKCSECFMCHRI